MRFVFIGKWLDCIIKDSAIMLNSYCLVGKNHKKQCWRRRALGGLAATALAARFAQSGLTGGRHADR